MDTKGKCLYKCYVIDLGENRNVGANVWEAPVSDPALTQD